MSPRGAAGDSDEPGHTGDPGGAADSGGAGGGGDADDALLGELADAVALADPVPERWQLAGAATAADWLALPAQPAELTYDSLDDVRPAGTTAAEGSERRRLRYDAPGVTVEVELTVTTVALRLTGRVLPPAPCLVRALQPRHAHATEANDGGAFQLDDLPRAPVSLVVERDPPVKTGWIVP